ncbi:MAG TPA: hypothetical protein PKK10_06035 [Woeseiaceae bacterium]|nr:hypothetical protein [Woeseiaceae bacterium]
MAALNEQVSDQVFIAPGVTDVSTLTGLLAVPDVEDKVDLAINPRVRISVDRSGHLYVHTGEIQDNDSMMWAGAVATWHRNLPAGTVIQSRQDQPFGHNLNRSLIAGSSDQVYGYGKYSPNVWITERPNCISFYDDDVIHGDAAAYSPFDYLDSENVRNAGDQIESVLNLPRNDVQSIYSRLLDKLEISIEDPELRVMSWESVRFFVEFLREYSSIRTPLIFLLSSGEVKATWRVSEREILSIEFAADGTVEYIAFAPNSRRQSVTQISSADGTSWRDVIPTLSQGSNLDWLWDSNG